MRVDYRREVRLVELAVERIDRIVDAPTPARMQ